MKKLDLQIRDCVVYLLQGMLAQWLERRLETMAGSLPFTPHYLCLSDETQKAVGPFYLVFVSGDVKDPTQS